MALPIFTPPTPPSTGMGNSHTPRAVITAFGDGYTQRMGDGLNTSPVTCTPIWKFLTAANAKLITDFFEARAGWQAFLYQRPRDLAPRKWICKTWSDMDDEPDMVTVSATFMEVFDP